MYTLFRHPVEAAVSLFYYKKRNTWEPNYDPKYAQQTVEQYVKDDVTKSPNWMAWMLGGGVVPAGPVEENSLYMEKIKELLRDYFIVGLLNQLDESVARFERAFGYRVASASMANFARAGSQVVGNGTTNNLKWKDDILHAGRNGAKHQTLSPTDMAWKEIAAINAYDMAIYEYAATLFQEQARVLPHAFNVQSDPMPPWRRELSWCEAAKSRTKCPF